MLDRENTVIMIRTEPHSSKKILGGPLIHIVLQCENKTCENMKLKQNGRRF